MVKNLQCINSVTFGFTTEVIINLLNTVLTSMEDMSLQILAKDPVETSSRNDAAISISH